MGIANACRVHLAHVIEKIRGRTNLSRNVIMSRWCDNDFAKKKKTNKKFADYFFLLSVLFFSFFFALLLKIHANWTRSKPRHTRPETAKVCVVVSETTVGLHFKSHKMHFFLGVENKLFSRITESDHRKLY